MNHKESMKSILFFAKNSSQILLEFLITKVTNVGCFGRFFLLYSASIVEMFLLPRMVRDAISLLHPDKTTQPFIAFGGKLYGPRAFILGFPNKDVVTVSEIFRLRGFWNFEKGTEFIQNQIFQEKPLL